jgi:predicted small metal-binding protein
MGTERDPVPESAVIPSYPRASARHPPPTAIDCPCGHRLEGADDDELLRQARDHVDRDHPKMERSDDELRQRIAADAYEVAAA